MGLGDDKSSRTQIGLGPKGEPAPCQKLPRRMRSSAVGVGEDGDSLGWSMASETALRCAERASEPDPESFNRKDSFAGRTVKMTYTTSHNDDRAGGELCFHCTVTKGLRRALAHGVLLISPGRSPDFRSSGSVNDMDDVSRLC